MFTKRIAIVGVLVLGGVLLASLFFIFKKRSESNSIQYENSQAFTREMHQEETREELAEAEEPIKEALGQEDQKADAKEPPSASTSDGQGKEEQGQELALKKFTLKSRPVSFGHESASGRTINTIVLHSSHAVNGDPYDVDAVIALWKSYGVAPHYMIARNGTVYQLVSDKNIAYHAGDSKMPDGRKNINDFSIGVEILNTKTDTYTSAQYQATKDLIAYLKKKYGKMEVVGHDTIAPGRKTDPWNFDWDKI